MKETWCILFGLIKKMMFILLLTSIMDVSNHAKCVSLNIQQCMIQPTLINIHPNEDTEGLHYYPFAVNLDRCVQSCNALNDLSNRLCMQSKTKSESKCFQYDYRNKLIETNNKSMYLVNINVNLMLENVIQINSGITINVDVSKKNLKELH